MSLLKSGAASEGLFAQEDDAFCIGSGYWSASLEGSWTNALLFGCVVSSDRENRHKSSNGRSGVYERSNEKYLVHGQPTAGRHSELQRWEPR